jgi:hypothetical protein
MVKIMHGIPDNFPHSSLPGAQLLQVCFGENDLILNFSGNMSILVMSSVSVGPSLFEADFVKLSSAILSLLAKEIVESSQSDNGRILSLRLSGGETISILDDSLEYESCVVTIDTSRFVI